MLPISRLWITLTLMLVALAGVAGCGGDKPDASDKSGASPSNTPSAKVSPAPGTKEMIMVADNQITPKGKLVFLRVGETLKLEIMADQPGELHVHSTPEQMIKYPAGTSTHNLVIKRPGVVEVEDHETGSLVLKLQVR
ncbi:MAG TPA: hypothetical protein PKX56_06895 [Marmoricola sp.]|nr:hypothetical protein [Marmoricola sp.]HNI70324.1 hypothetical protein [Marmoricola sp.]HNJ79066.1 hypothetical protein [Marmoricola sp.]HNN48318.1 hypothetical protein [Marmoricola sp.]